MLLRKFQNIPTRSDSIDTRGLRTGYSVHIECKGLPLELTKNKTQFNLSQFIKSNER